MALEDVSAVAEPVEAIDPVEPVEPAEGVEEIEPVEGAEPVEGIEPDAEEVAGDGRVIPQQYRDLFKQDKTLKAMFFANREFMQQFPEGPNQAKEVMSIIAEIGGREGIDSLKGEARELKQIDAMLANGDPQAIERFAKQSPEGFAKLAPEVMNKWYAVDPEGCNRTLCGVIANTFRSGNFETNLFLAGKMLEVGKPEEALNILKGMQEWARSFSTEASKPAAIKEKPNTDMDRRAQELDQRESQMWTENLTRSIVAARDPMIAKELEPFIKGRQLSETKREILQEAILKRASATMNADAAFTKSWNALIARKDTDGALKLSKSKMGEILPQMVAKVAREILGSPVAKKPATAAAAQTSKGDAGWTVVSKPPAPSEIHPSTTFEQRFEGKFILKDGRKVVYQQ